MKNIDIYDNSGNSKEKYEFKSDIDNIPIRTDLYNDVIRYQLLKRRQGTANTKTRKDVRGGGAKPYRQKGTGRARAGTRRSPLWVGGGIVFGPHPRDYSIKLPKKVRRIALRSSLAQYLTEENYKVIDGFSFEKPNTREFLEVIRKLGLKGKILIILSEEEFRNENNTKSMRNVSYIDYLSCNGLNLYSILKSNTLLFTKSAMDNIEKEILQ